MSIEEKIENIIKEQFYDEQYWPNEPQIIIPYEEFMELYYTCLDKHWQVLLYKPEPPVIEESELESSGLFSYSYGHTEKRDYNNKEYQQRLEKWQRDRDTYWKNLQTIPKVLNYWCAFGELKIYPEKMGGKNDRRD